MAENSSEDASFECEVIATVAAQEFFVPGKSIWVARAPGRLDVMGGNVDYTGGMVLQSLLREAVWVAVQTRSDQTLRILNPGALQFGWVPRLEFRMVDLRDPESLRMLCEQQAGSRWGCYVLGAIYFLMSSYGCGKGGGIDLFIASDLPPNKGVSSSAALEIATLKAVSAAWGVSLHGVTLATAGQWVENIVAGAACGIMDQAAIVCGEENRLLPLLCQPCQIFPLIALPPGIRIWGIDSMESRSTASVGYEKARAAAFMGYKLICRRMGIEVTPDPGSKIPRWTDSRWNGYLSQLAPSQFRDRFERWLPESLSGREFLDCAGEHVDPFTRIDPAEQYPVRAAVRYATEENLRVQMLFALLATPWSEPCNSLRLAGELLLQSHFAYTECGLGSDACDELVARALDAGLPGAKMTGGGAGGVVAVLGRVEDRHVVETIAREYAAQHGADPHLFEGSSAGADSFGVRTVQLAPAKRTQQ
ncbi:galactokinase family protein [Terriglobus saanensis]|uniref:Galactokinase n=1 Tax=Terriglobus saanensis (strain ATCC BAA-1853 / DSM 23119 / SP1PR4) TaxID=401053 RepID=E8UZP1_TERSS|nr:galactokinase family protein [Terriglobus saanensis]ADV84384.1 Galactokinase [Terriglobus saanensis SP1PR4]